MGFVSSFRSLSHVPLFWPPILIEKDVCGDSNPEVGAGLGGLGKRDSREFPAKRVLERISQPCDRRALENDHQSCRQSITSPLFQTLSIVLRTACQ